MAESLRDKTVRGVGWNTINTVTRKTISFLVTVVLARLVTPEEYGLVGLVGVVSMIIGGFVDCGLGSALVRKKDATEDDYNTVFIMNMVMSVLVFAVVFFTAPLVARFFHQPRLTLLTRVAAIGIIIGSVGMVQSIQLTKKLDFKTPAKMTVISCTLSGIIGIVMAAMGCGAWALLGQSLSATVINVILLWFYNRWKPKLHFSKSSFKELFGFGSKLLASRMIDTFWGQIENIVIGRFYNPATLGQYNRGHSYAELFSSNLTGIVQGVTYPSLSQLQDEPERLKQAYRKVIKVTMLATLCCMFGLSAVSKSIVYVLVGDQWAEAAKYLAVLCIPMAFFPLHAINLNMLEVKGRSDLFLRFEIIKKIVAILPLVLGATVSVWAMLWTNVALCPVYYFINSYYSGRLIGYSMKDQIKDILPSIGVATLMFVLVYPLSKLQISYYLMLPLQVICGVAIVALCCELTKLEEWGEVKSIALQYTRKIFHKKDNV